MISLVRLIEIYGKEGLKSYMKLKLGRISYHRFKNRIHETVFIPGYKNPILLRSHTTDYSTFKQIFHSKEYDMDFDFEPKVIIDAGANIGLTSIYFTNRFPKALIYAIEPEPTNFEALRTNVTNYKNIKIYMAALHHTAKQDLLLYDRGIGHWGYSTQKEELGMQPKSCTLVKTVSIEYLMECNQIDCIDILKIDIEGAEKELFTNNYNVWLPKTKTIIIEFHDNYVPGSEVLIRKILNEFGFDCFQKGENWVFLNNKIN